ncbi:hypothetical protein HPB50_017611 [Hyalomma asiaticum]|uniref:Uncharacterized protein n=1 Tax=Hyalomma asiaticum TaxID=266040 RepID=A0ACB7TJJ6_HYAAI|nr:hypothetical protein HPB50_017611 [Hyalomma asiaticum]
MLRFIGTERLTIYAFGSREAVQERSCQRVECWLRNWSNNKRVRIEALEMPEIGGDKFLPPPDASAENIAREISRQLRSFWELEHLGIVDDTQLTAEGGNVLRAYEDTIVRKNGRYEVGLPWKENA